MLSGLGGKSDWAGRIRFARAATTVSIVDDPSAKEFSRYPAARRYAVDDEGVRAQKVTVVDKGNLKELLMSRRPGPDTDGSNGHGRSGFLGDAKPTMSNLFFNASEPSRPPNLRKSFWTNAARKSWTTASSFARWTIPHSVFCIRKTFLSCWPAFGGGAGTGDRLPLVAYRVYPQDGREEIIRGARIIGVNTRSLRNLAGIGNDNFVYNYMQSQVAGFAGTRWVHSFSAAVCPPQSSLRHYFSKSWKCAGPRRAQAAAAIARAAAKRIEVVLAPTFSRDAPRGHCATVS